MASRSVNKVILIGHLGRDAETKFTPAGNACTRFLIATSRSWKDQQSDEWKEETNWTNIVVWRKENLAEYLTKGKQVYVEGRLQTRSYDGQDGKRVYVTEVVAEDVLLLGGRSDEQSSGARTQQTASRRTANGTGNGRGNGSATAVQEDDGFAGMGITDDDVPFN
jgi:single-strand DNA-binding protein